MAKLQQPGELEAGSSTTQVDEQDEDIVIRVCDRNVTKNFTCKKSVLISRMRYFRNHLTANSAYDIDISVHCDVQIFEWLIRYIHKPEDPPLLSASSVVSILISSEFLEMTELLELCISYVSQHLNEILRIPLDFTCLTETVIRKLALLTPDKVLAGVKDRKDRVLSKLYRRRVEVDFINPVDLRCCEHCHQVFPKHASSTLRCAQAGEAIDHRGRSLRFHSPISGWSAQAFVDVLRERGISWPDLYWLLWGRSRTARCRTCGEHSVLGDTDGCRSHGIPAVFSDGDLRGVHPCCGASVLRFSMYSSPPGCQARDHVYDAQMLGDFEVHMLHNRRQWILALDWRETHLKEAAKAGANAGGQAMDGGPSSGDDEDDESVRWKQRRRPSPHGPRSHDATSPTQQRPTRRRRGSTAGSGTARLPPSSRCLTRPRSRAQPQPLLSSSSRSAQDFRRRRRELYMDDGGVESEDDAEEPIAKLGPLRSREGEARNPRGTGMAAAMARGSNNGIRSRSKGGAARGVTAVEVHHSASGGALSRGVAPPTEAEKALAAAFACYCAIPLGRDGQPAACIEEVMPGGHPLQAVSQKCAEVMDNIRDARLSPGRRREWLIDAQRDQDALRMRLLGKRLSRLRTGARSSEKPQEQADQRAGRDPRNIGRSSSIGPRPDSRDGRDQPRTAIARSRRLNSTNNAPSGRAQTADRPRRDTR